MPSLVVVGAQWGDEGKGKLVDFLTLNAHYVVRFQGGNNAGHTLVVNGQKTKLSLVPSGILRPQAKCCLAAGVVVNAEVLLNEISMLQQAGVEVNPDRLVLDRNAHLIMPYHVAIDQAREHAKGEKKIGTTGRGIGPAYEDRASREGVRVAELLDLPALRSRLEEVLRQRNRYLEGVLESDPVPFDQVWRWVSELAPRVVPFIGNVSLELSRALAAQQRVVFEGAQGTLLDQTFGTVPFVTSSHTIAAGAACGSGLGPRSVDHVLAVAKAYTTRVGSGPFPTELDDETGELIRTKGAEFGTVTGRSRRCGWFDAFAMRSAVRLNGANSLAITKLDVLAGLPSVKICINYRVKGKKLEDVPALASELDCIEPEYIELEGWDDSIADARKWHELPASARLYLATIAEIVGCPVTIASVGAEREATLFSTSAAYVRTFAE